MSANELPMGECETLNDISKDLAEKTKDGFDAAVAHVRRVYQEELDLRNEMAFCADIEQLSKYITPFVCGAVSTTNQKILIITAHPENCFSSKIEKLIAEKSHDVTIEKVPEVMFIIPEVDLPGKKEEPWYQRFNKRKRF